MTQQQLFHSESNESLEAEVLKQILIIEAIRTIPLQVESANIFMNFRGISEPKTMHKDGKLLYEVGGEERYLSDCKKHSIIPFSDIKFVYDGHLGLFIQESGYYIVKNYRSFSYDRMEQTVQTLISGGRIHILEINIDTPTVFQKFREGFLDLLLTQEYKLDHGIINIRNRSTNTNISILFDTNNELVLYQDVSDKQSFADWINELKQKYQPE